ncbi:hypothetical protein C3Z06_13000 [Cupriavidus metallidurans]|nr:hypothetical protein C3Z06_13000 [Cupriavidus metallidurans]
MAVPGQWPARHAGRESAPNRASCVCGIRHSTGSGAYCSPGVLPVGIRAAYADSWHCAAQSRNGSSPCLAPPSSSLRRSGATGQKTLAFVARHGTLLRSPSLLDTIKATSSLRRVHARSLREPLQRPSPFLLKSPRFRHHESCLCTVSLPLPWDQKHRQDRELAAKLAQADAARAQSEVVRRSLIGQLRGRQEELGLNQVRIERFRSATVPLAKAQTEAAMTAYRTGAGTLTAVADASRKALNISLERLQLEASSARLWAELTFLMPLPTAAQNPSLQGAQP